MTRILTMGGTGILGEPDEPQDEIPDWYEFVKAAQYLGVAPWDLLEQPIWWFQWGYEAMIAESKAQEQHHQRQQARMKAHKR